MDSTTRVSRGRGWARLRTFVFGVVGVIAVYGLVAGVAAPYFARKPVAEKLGEKLGRTVAIDDITFNPYTLNARVRGLRILEADGKTTFASFEQLNIDGSISSAWRMAPIADEVALGGLKLHLVRDGETHYNVSDILGRLAQASKAKEKGKDEAPARFSLSNIRVVNARIDFDDQPRGRKHAVSDINIAVPFVSNLPRHLKEYVQPSFAANVNGTPLRVKGETKPFEDSLTTHIALDLDRLDVPRYAEYSPTPLPVKVDTGLLDARIAVRFTQKAGKNPSVDVAGKLALRDLRLSTADGTLAEVGRTEIDVESLDPLAGLARIGAVRIADVKAAGGEWRVPALEAQGIAVDLGGKTVRVASVATRDGVVALKRRADGSIEIPVHVAATGDPAAAAPAPWSAALDRLTVDNYTVSLADAAVRPATTHRVGITHLEAGGLGTGKDAKGTLDARLDLGRGGSVALESTFGLDPLVLKAKVDARHIDLVSLRPYAAHFQTVALKSGNASARGVVSIEGEGDRMRVAYTGTAEVANVAARDTANREDLLNWRAVRLADVKFRWSKDTPLTLAVNEIAVDKAYARVVVTPEGKINLTQLKFATPDEPQVPTPAGEEPKPRDIRIDRVVFADSRLDFSDHFIKPNYSADVGGLSGTVTGLSSDPASRGVVDLEGRYDETSPVIIKGTVNPLSGDLFLDVAAKGENIELPKLSAYSVRYAGYGIREGKLTLDVKYHLEDGKLQGRNNIRLDQLTFGDKVDSPEATTLPVLFAVNLLKDSQGRISLDLPISGSLDDPQFELSGLITQVVTSLLKKAITNPFSLLTAAFGGGGGGKDGAASASGGEDLAYVDFDPGRAEIGDAGKKKLGAVAKALLDRPAIRLEMAPRVDTDRDLAALKRAALLRKVREVKGDDVVTFDAADYPRWLKAAYEREVAPKEPKKDAPKNDAPKTDAPKKDAPKPEPTVAEMEAALLEHVAVDDTQLAALAQQRADHVRAWLTGEGKLPAERLLVAEGATGGAHLTRVDFTLK